jgi:hypothetical protein
VATVGSSSLTVGCSYVDATGQQFEYRSSALGVAFNNPVSLSVTLLNSDQIVQRVRVGDTFREVVVTGAYAGRDAPVIARVSLKLRGQPATFISFTASTKEDGADVGDPVRYTAGNTDHIDISVPVPDRQVQLRLEATTKIGNFSSTAGQDMSFLNPLQIEITPHTPEVDGVTRAEQTAAAWYVNPDDPSVVTQLPDLTVVKWSSPFNVPFYSTDSVRLPDGVFSYVRNGTARKVFVGPLSPNMTPGSIQVVAVVTYNGFTAVDSVQLRPIFPDGPSDTTRAVRFLAEFPEIINPLYADGLDYVRMTIVHDPEATTSDFSQCFLDCAAQTGNEIVKLPAGLPVVVSGATSSPRSSGVTPERFR